MSADRDAQGPVVERYALARHGLPLPRSTASVPRAPWLPAAVRGRALPGSPRAMPIPSVLEANIEEAFDPGIAFTQPPSLARFDAGAAAPVARMEAALPQRDTSSLSSSVREHDEATTGNAPIAHALPSQPDASVRSTQTLRPPVDNAAPASSSAVRQEARRNDAIGDSTRVRDRPVRRESFAPHGETSNTTDTTVPRSAGPSFPSVEIPASGSDPRHADRVESMETSTLGDRVSAPAERIAATPAVARQARDARPISVVQGGTQMQVMGLAAAPLDPTRSQATAATGERPAPARQIGAAELAALQAPAPTPARSVRIDRVQVTVQAPAMPGPRPSGAPAAMPATPARAPAQPGFRNPWSSYFTRRD